LILCERLLNGLISRRNMKGRNVFEEVKKDLLLSRLICTDKSLLELAERYVKELEIPKLNLSFYANSYEIDAMIMGQFKETKLLYTSIIKYNSKFRLSSSIIDYEFIQENQGVLTPESKDTILIRETKNNSVINICHKNKIFYLKKSDLSKKNNNILEKKYYSLDYLLTELNNL